MLEKSILKVAIAALVKMNHDGQHFTQAYLHGALPSDLTTSQQHVLKHGFKGLAKIIDVTE